jgi:hypothetical protein
LAVAKLQADRTEEQLQGQAAGPTAAAGELGSSSSGFIFFLLAAEFVL